MNLDSAEEVQSDIEFQQEKHTGRKVPRKRLGNYTLIREIGRGGFSTVFKGMSEVTSCRRGQGRKQMRNQANSKR